MMERVSRIDGQDMEKRVKRGDKRCMTGTYLQALQTVRSVAHSQPLWVWAGRAASAITIGAALILALIHYPSMRWLFVAWSISNMLWLWYAVKLRSGSLMSAQSVFLIIDVVGMTHYWILGSKIWMGIFG